MSVSFLWPSFSEWVGKEWKLPLPLQKSKSTDFGGFPFKEASFAIGNGGVFLSRRGLHPPAFRSSPRRRRRRRRRRQTRQTREAHPGGAGGFEAQDLPAPAGARRDRFASLRSGPWAREFGSGAIGGPFWLGSKSRRRVLVDLFFSHLGRPIDFQPKRTPMVRSGHGRERGWDALGPAARCPLFHLPFFWGGGFFPPLKKKTYPCSSLSNLEGMESEGSDMVQRGWFWSEGWKMGRLIHGKGKVGIVGKVWKLGTSGFVMEETEEKHRRFLISRFELQVIKRVGCII